MSKHPFEGEGFDRERSMRFWNDMAYDYDGRIMQGDIPLQAMEQLANKGIVGPDKYAVEFGCGPGTYTVPLSAVSRSVTCVDSSERMLSMLSEICASSNVFPVLGDYMDVDLGRTFDVSVMSLCPGSGTPEGIRRAESVTHGWCVHLMWTENRWDDVHAEVWKQLGKDYSFEGRKSGIMESNLSAMGRSYEATEFLTDICWNVRAKDIIERESRVFSLYGDYDTEGALRSVLDRYIDGDTFTFECTNRVKMITWRPPSC